MLEWKPDTDRLSHLRGSLIFTENGDEVGLRRAYATAALVGVCLRLPRELGTVYAALSVARDGRGTTTLPLRYCGSEKGTDRYAALVDSASFLPQGGVLLCRLTVDGLYGRCGTRQEADGSLSLHLREEGDAFSLFFAESAYPAPTWLFGGSLFVLPLSLLPWVASEYGRDFLSFFAHLSGLGVRALWLAPPCGEEKEGGSAPSALLSAFLPAARQFSIQILYDFLLVSGAREGGGMFVRDTRDGACDSSGGEPDARMAFWNSPQLSDGEDAVCPAFFFGEGGVVSRYSGEPGGGFVLRAADRFGDTFLSALRGSMTAMGEDRCPLLLGATEAGADAIAFGVRRRFFSGWELGAPLSRVLRQALEGYLLRGETAPLARYLSTVLPALPSFVACTTPALLSDYESGLFADACRAGDPDHAVALSRLAYLIAGTLPGVLAYGYGEEYGAEPEKPGGTLAYHIRIARLREKEAVYRSPALRLLHIEKDLLIFSREREGEALLTVINPSPHPMRVVSRDGFYVVFGGRGRKTAFPLPPRSGLVVKVARWAGETCRLRVEPLSLCSGAPCREA